MTERDEAAFTATFQRLRAIFPLRADTAELTQIARLYFRVLARWPIESVEAGADAWMSSGTRFPKPGEWVQAIPHSNVLALRALSDDEAAEHRRAVARKYEDEPCRCFLCQQASVTHRMLRYVPDEDINGRDLRGTLDGKSVVRGHWAHGEELARWYVARDAYFALKQTVKPKTMRPSGSMAALEQRVRELVSAAPTVQATIEPTSDPLEILT